MEAKSHGLDPKENGTNDGVKNKLNEHYKINRNVRVIDRIVELYRNVLRVSTSETTFQQTIEVMISLGYYSSIKTQCELKVLYEVHMAYTYCGSGNVVEESLTEAKVDLSQDESIAELLNLVDDYHEVYVWSGDMWHLQCICPTYTDALSVQDNLKLHLITKIVSS